MPLYINLNILYIIVNCLYINFNILYIIVNSLYININILYIILNNPVLPAFPQATCIYFGVPSLSIDLLSIVTSIVDSSSI